MVQGFAGLPPPGSAACSAAPRSALLSSGFSEEAALSVRGASRRCAASTAFVQSASGSGESRKQRANISGVRGQRLSDSNPIKHRLGQPWRRAGGRRRVEPCGSAPEASGGGPGWETMVRKVQMNVAEGTLEGKRFYYSVSLSMFGR